MENLLNWSAQIVAVKDTVQEHVKLTTGQATSKSVA